MKKFDIPQLEGVFSEPWSWKKFVGLLGLFGPAAIFASVSIVSGYLIVSLGFANETLAQVRAVLEDLEKRVTAAIT